MDWVTWGIWLLGAYLIGALPFGLFLGRLKGVDIREHGSGNLGATNVGRVLGKRLGLLCFALDVLKGLGPVLAFALLSGAIDRSPSSLHAQAGLSPTLLAAQWLAIALAAVCGHVFPVYLGFRGGKGVATSLGALLGLFPYLTLPALLGFVAWYITVKASGYVGLASVTAAVVLPVLTFGSGVAWGLSAGPITVFTTATALLAALVIFRHRGNLSRIHAGTEPKAKWAKRDSA